MTNWKDIKDIATHGADLERKRSVPLHLVVVGPEGPTLRAVMEQMVPLTDRAAVELAAVGKGATAVEADADLVVVVCETLPPGMSAVFEELRRRRIPFLALRPSTSSRLSRPSDESLRQLGAGEAIDLDIGGEGLEDQLFEVLIRKLSDKKLALCANFAGARAHAAKDVINHTAWQNGAIAGVIIIPGADMPILTGNQVKMVLELAAIYGKQMTFARAKELIAVVGAGFTLRTAARELVGLLPGPGWPVKAAIAYGGTVAVGKAAQQYMIHGDEWVDSAREKMSALRERNAQPAPEDTPRLDPQASLEAPKR